MGERQRGARRRGKCRGHSRHDGAGNVVGGEHLELLAATAEHEGISALQPRDALPGERMAQQELMDALLLAGHARALADEDSLGVAPCTVEHFRTHQAIVEDHIRLLEQLQRAQGEEIRVPGSGADQEHLTERALTVRAPAAHQLRAAQLPIVGSHGSPLIPGNDAARDRATDDALPEAPACGRGQGVFHAASPSAHEARQHTEARRKKCLDLCAYAAGQNRSATCRAHRDQDGGAVDDRRKDEGGEQCVIDHVDGYAAFLCRLRHRAVDGGIVGCRDHRGGSLEVRAGERRGDVAQRSISHLRGERRIEPRCDDGDLRPGRAQRGDLAQRYRTATHDRDRAPVQAQKYGQIVHHSL